MAHCAHRYPRWRRCMLCVNDSITPGWDVYMHGALLLHGARGEGAWRILHPLSSSVMNWPLFYPDAFPRAAITVEDKPAEGRVGLNDFCCLLPFSCPLFPQVPRRTAPFSPLWAGRAPTPHWRRSGRRTGGAGRCVRRAAGGSTV